MTTAQASKQPWFVNLIARFQQLADRIDMPDEATAEIRQFMIEIAKEQYLAGNRSGIAWIRKQMRDGEKKS